jgi:hypothetical protein
MPLIGNKNKLNTESASTDVAQCDEQNFKYDRCSRLIGGLIIIPESKCKHCTRALFTPSLYYIQCNICGNIETPACLVLSISLCIECMILPYQLCHITLTSTALSTPSPHVYIRVITVRMGTISICYSTIFCHKYPRFSHQQLQTVS